MMMAMVRLMEKCKKTTKNEVEHCRKGHALIKGKCVKTQTKGNLENEKVNWLGSRKSFIPMPNLEDEHLKSNGQTVHYRIDLLMLTFCVILLL